LFSFLRKSKSVEIVSNAKAFWRYCDANQRIQNTPDGSEADAEEKHDLAFAKLLSELLTREVGPEGGERPCHIQNWDWNDDRCRAVSILREKFRPELIALLQATLTGSYSDFVIIVMINESWNDDEWGHLRLSATSIAIERNVAEAYSIAS
jgi:hypothetical protein